MELHDLIIIGGGPAGVTASVYAARKKLDFILITPSIGGQTVWSGEVENYTGYNFITGPELAAKFEEHMKQFEIELKEFEIVEGLRKKGSVIEVHSNKAVYQTKTVIIASGKVSRELNVAGEKEFKNKGVTYCATCDGPLFAGKDVVVVGGGKSALDAVLQLVKIATHVYMVNNTKSLNGDPVLIEKVEKDPAVTIFNNSRVTEILGDKSVTGLSFEKEGKAQTIFIKGVFVEIGLIPNSDFVKDLKKNAIGEIMINNENETNIPGVFAAGDVTNVQEKQIIIAAGEGAKAALSAFKYLMHN